MSKQQEVGHPREARLRIELPTGDTYERKVGEGECHLGRGSHNDILIIDPAVSTTHAMLALYGDSYFILDEGSEGGTFVNGEKVTKPRKLSHGDVIKIGKSQITFLLKLGAEALEAMLAQAASPAAAVETEAASNDQESEEEKEKKKHKKDKHKDKTDEQTVSVAEVNAASNGQGSEEKKEKKKHKKEKDKEKDKASADARIKAARVRAWGGIIATVLSVVLTVTISIMVSQRGSNQPTVQVAGGGQSAKYLASPSDTNRISGGKYEASGAATVPGTNGVLFVDDSKPDHVFYMPVNELGEQEGPVKAIPLGVTVENPEGITQIGTQYVIVGSLSTQESNDAGGVATFDFDPATQTVSKAAALTGMRKFLFDNVPELRAWADKTSIEGGLNVEAIAYDPNPEHPRVLLGLRGPVLNGRALVVPIKQRDRQAPFSIENLIMGEPNAIQLDLDGQAIRDMQYDPRLKSFLIISGAPETEEKTNFTLWVWNGDGDQGREDANPKMQTLLDKKMKPEGVAHLKIGNQEFVFIVGDANSYLKIDYIPQ